MPNLRLKNIATLQSGGTPRVDDSTMWSDDDMDGIPWLSIGDMPDGGIASSASRNVSEKGVLDRNLPIGALGTVLFAMYASVGSVAILGIEATWNQAILGMTVDDRRANQRFLYYWLQALRPVLPSLYRSNTQNNLNAELVGNLPFTSLSTDEQALIANYLDTEIFRIDALISKKQRMVELLDERLDAAIRAALGNVRCGWLPLKRRWKVIDCKHRTPDYLDDGIPVVSPGDATPGRLDLSRAHRFVSQEDFEDLTEPPRGPIRGDIIYSRNASIGIASYVDTDQKFCMGQDVCLITSVGQSQLYLSYVLNTLGVDQLDEAKIGSTFNRVNISQIVELRIPAPEPEVQFQLASKFESLTQYRDTLTSKFRVQISLLNQRRQALITAAVTGQIDIPEVAA